MLRTSQSVLTSPKAKMDRPGPVSVLQSASADAIFIGCCSNIRRVWKWPLTAIAIPEAKVNHIAPRSERRSPGGPPPGAVAPADEQPG